jgi:hypothetical protein
MAPLAHANCIIDLKLEKEIFVEIVLLKCIHPDISIGNK